MSGNLGYTKKFIILKKDFSNMSGLSPKGHGKLEVKGLKGSIAISLENAQDNDYYNVVLISKNASYDLGKVYTDDNGKAREDLVFNLQDLESKGFSIDRINGIVVKRDSNILVGGYIDKDDGSLERYIKKLPIRETRHEEPVFKELEVEETVVEEVIVVEEPEIKETVIEEVIIEEPIIEEPVALIIESIIEKPSLEVPVEVVEELEEPVLEESIFKAPLSEEEKIISTNDNFKYELTNDLIIEQILEPEVGADFEPIFEPILELSQEPEPVAEQPIEQIIFVEEQPIEEHNVMVDPVESEELVRDIIEKIPITEEYVEEVLEKVDLDSEHNRRISQRNQTTSYILNILRYFPYIEPFRIRLEGYNWWKVDFQDEARGFLPYFSYVVGGEQKSRRSDNYVTSRDLMGIYNHYLFGLYTVGEEVAYYVYAVPGGFYKEEHPHGGSTGFNTWFAGEYIDGYWLLYIDPLTGNVINPINPMIPTE